jgi:Tetracyclin repressor-like HI_0893, C-terminal domain
VQQDQNIALLVNRFRSRSTGGLLKDLPQEVLWDLSLGAAIRLAKRATPLETEVLEEIAASCWRAVT